MMSKEARWVRPAKGASKPWAEGTAGAQGQGEHGWACPPLPCGLALVYWKAVGREWMEVSPGIPDPPIPSQIPLQACHTPAACWAVGTGMLRQLRAGLHQDLQKV